MKINVLVSNYFHGVRVIVEFGIAVAKLRTHREAERQLLGTFRTQPLHGQVEAEHGV